MKKLVLFLVCLLVLVVPVSYAKSSESILHKTSLHDIMTICIQERIPAAMDVDNDSLIFNISDDTVALLLIHELTTSIHFAALYQGSKTHSVLSMMRIANEWNKKNYYSKSYVVDQDMMLELDLDFDGGITRERIVDFLRVCFLSTELWEEFIRAQPTGV